MTEDELDFLYVDKEHTIKRKLTVDNFNVGLKVPGKLIPKRIPGGVLLVDCTYEMR